MRFHRVPASQVRYILSINPQRGDLLPGEDCTLKELRHQHIERVMERCEGKQGKAAKILGINKVTIERWIRGIRDNKLRELLKTK